ncbi:hypothetical protein QVM80_28635, partial [Enterobacter hormaechei]|uniref:hypothetical protein n=1 Tax=Enterobacter hormaechei TaxID=158836 RepID=UPI0035249E01
MDKHGFLHQACPGLSRPGGEVSLSVAGQPASRILTDEAEPRPVKDANAGPGGPRWIFLAPGAPALP